TAGLLAKSAPAGLPRYWTVRGGMQGLWERVATGLDVRCGARVRAVERRDGGVRVWAGDDVLEFDALVIAIPLERALGFLDATVEERMVTGRVRHHDYYTTVC